MTMLTSTRAHGRSVRADRRDELEAHRQEALAFVDECWPLVSRLEVAAQALGPIAHQTVLALGARLARYERRHLDPEPEAPAVAA